MIEVKEDIAASDRLWRYPDDLIAFQTGSKVSFFLYFLVR